MKPLSLPECFRPTAALLLWPSSVLAYALTAASHTGQAGFAAGAAVLPVAAWMALRSVRRVGAAGPPVPGLLVLWSAWVLITQLSDRAAPDQAWAPTLMVPLLCGAVLVAHLAGDRERLQHELALGAALSVLLAAACCPLLLATGRPFATAAVFGFDNLNLLSLLCTPLVVVGLATPGSGRGHRLRRTLLWLALGWLIVVGVATGRRGQSLFLVFAAALWLSHRLLPRRAARWWRIVVPIGGLTALLLLGLLVLAPEGSAILEPLREVDGKRIAIYRAALPGDGWTWLIGRGPAPTLHLPAGPLGERSWSYLGAGMGPLGHAHDSFLQQLAGSGLPALFALLALVGLALWRSLDRRQPELPPARLLAIVGASLALLVEDLTLRPEGAVTLGLLLGLALHADGDSRPGSRIAASLGLTGSALAALVLFGLWWTPTWIRDGSAADHLRALEASRDPSHATWHLLRLIERGDPESAPQVRSAVESRLGPLMALRWAAAAPPARREGDAAAWARLHPLDLSTAGFLPGDSTAPRIVAGRALAAIHAGIRSPDQALATLRRILATYPHDPALTWSLLRIRSSHPELIDALEVP